MEKPKPKSRFAFQHGTYGNVAPPSFHNAASNKLCTNAAGPVATARKVKDYFDDDEDEEDVQTTKAVLSETVEDDFDPLDAFM